MAKTFKKFVIGFDLHGDLQDTATVNAFHRFVRDYKPHTRVAGGDVFDFTAFRGRASTEEKRTSLTGDFASGIEFIEQFRPDALLIGNHDRRLWSLAAESSGPLADFAGELVARVDGLLGKFRGRLLPYDKESGVLQLGKLNVLHGFFSGQNAAVRHAQIYGPCIFGHIHTASHIILPSYRGDCEAWSAPCLCQKRMDYNRETPITLRYANGWAYGVYSDTSYHVELARVENGSVIVANDFKVMAA